MVFGSENVFLSMTTCLNTRDISVGEKHLQIMIYSCQFHIQRNSYRVCIQVTR